MSGIAGILRFDGAPVAESDIRAMLATLRRRGPDHQRSWLHGNAALAQSLLATTPEALVEAQPFVAADTGCVLVSDSRLDNRPELVRKLGLRQPDADADAVGDGELLHAAWQRWGEGCVEHLLGDFAFALWDAATQSMFLARDVFGVRPLYYHHVPGRLLVFGSQADTVLALREVPADVDPARLADAMVGELEGADSVSSFFPAVKRLAPAHTLRVRADLGQLEPRRYWTPAPRSEDAGGAAGEWTDALREALRRAVQRRLRASTRVGSMMSGGVDSTAVVALASRADAGARFPVFSGIDSRGDSDETAGIRRMYQAFDLEPHCADLADLSDLLPELRAELDDLAEPFDGTMALLSAQYLMAGRAGVHVLLDGMPADLLYGIGDGAGELMRAGRLRQALAVLRNRYLADGRAWPGVAAVRSALWSLVPEALRHARMERLWKSEYRSLLSQSLVASAVVSAVDLERRHQDFRRACHGAHTGRAGTVMDAPYAYAAIDRYGRVAARHGVEPRHPFLDRELVELHRRIPVRLVNRGGWSKWPLRQAMADILPAPIAWGAPRRHLGAEFNVARTRGMAIGHFRGGLSSASLLDPAKADAAATRWRDSRDHAAFDAIQDAWLTLRFMAGNVPGVLESAADSAD